MARDPEQHSILVLYIDLLPAGAGDDRELALAIEKESDHGVARLELGRPTKLVPTKLCATALVLDA